MNHSSTPTPPAAPIAPCSLCDENHDEVLGLLAEGPDSTPRRIPSADLLAEQEYLQRELAEGGASPDYSASLAVLNRHRLAVIDTELDRRRRLEAYGASKVPNAGRIPQGVLMEIKSRIDLAGLVGEDLGDMAWYRWGKVTFACRLHGDGVDRNPSLTVYEEDRRWWCYGCNDGGDCFDWLIKARGMEWRQAAEHLAHRCGVELPEPTHPAQRPSSSRPHRTVRLKVG